jgi:hypothetical protein
MGRIDVVNNAGHSSNTGACSDPPENPRRHRLQPGRSICAKAVVPAMLEQTGHDRERGLLAGANANLLAGMIWRRQGPP